MTLSAAWINHLDKAFDMPYSGSMLYVIVSLAYCQHYHHGRFPIFFILSSIYIDTLSIGKHSVFVIEPEQYRI